MKKTRFLLFALLMMVSCGKNHKADDKNFDKISVDKNIVNNDTIRLLSKYPELKLFKKERTGSKTRTAYIVQFAGITYMDNYKCSAVSKNDTLEILLNNSNGYHGNGILIQVFADNFSIQDIDPKTLHGETKFLKTKPYHRKLVLNKNSFQKGDSIFGFVDYKTKVNSFRKDFRGYFKTIIK